MPQRGRRRASRRRSSPSTCARPSASFRRAGSDCGIANVNIGPVRRRDRRRLRRRKGDRRRPRGWLRRLEGLYAPGHQHPELRHDIAAGAGREVRHRRLIEIGRPGRREPSGTARFSNIRTMIPALCGVSRGRDPGPRPGRRGDRHDRPSRLASRFLRQGRGTSATFRGTILSCSTTSSPTTSA